MERHGNIAKWTDLIGQTKNKLLTKITADKCREIIKNLKLCQKKLK